MALIRIAFDSQELRGQLRPVMRAIASANQWEVQFLKRSARGNPREKALKAYESMRDVPYVYWTPFSVLGLYVYEQQFKYCVEYSDSFGYLMAHKKRITDLLEWRSTDNVCKGIIACSRHNSLSRIRGDWLGYLEDENQFRSMIAPAIATLPKRHGEQAEWVKQQMGESHRRITL